MSVVTTNAEGGEIIREIRGAQGMQATIWRNQTPSGPSHSLTLARSWKTQDGSWETRRIHLPLATLLPAAELLQASYRDVWDAIAAERKQGGKG